METKASSDESDKSCVTMETKNTVYLSSPPLVLKNGGFSLTPITPDSNKENAELTSPLTFYMDEEDVDNDTPSTPKEGVFDPFAPGPDNLMMAPLSMKYLEESRTYVARKLNFNSLITKNDCENVSKTIFDDNMLLEAVYDSLLEAIISKQAEDILAEISASDLLNTPPSAPRLTGIADTCPGAPLKPVKKSRTIDLSLCRKLEFDF